MEWGWGLEGEFVARRELRFFGGEVGSFVNEAGGGANGGDWDERGRGRGRG